MFRADTPSAGGSNQPDHRPVTSDVVVDPGEIRQFAKFLDEMAGEVEKVTQQVGDFTPEGTQKVDWGRYDSSGRAATKHRETVQDAHTQLKALHQRSTEVVDATQVLAGQYADLEDLNRASVEDVNAQLNKKKGA